ncbi:MAG: rhomboid family intramembrane serine protease [Parvularculaceae bacterium]|nr:rhomboid family intramembrane serine protease [Parvularculaceae bacterium]
MNDRPSVQRRRVGITSGGARYGGGPIFNIPEPISTVALLTIIATSGAWLVGSPTGAGRLVDDLSFVPVEFLARVENGEFLGAVIPLLGHIFMHGNTGHLLLNMAWLVVFGSGIARRFCLEGGEPDARSFNVLLFVGFYLSCGIAGAFLQFIWDPLSPIGLVGASGAISGLMAGTLRFALRLFAPFGAEYGKLAPVTARPVLMASLVYIGLNGATGIAGAMGVESAKIIAWQAHVGGFVFGLFAFPLFDRLVRRPKLPFGLG